MSGPMERAGVPGQGDTLTREHARRGYRSRLCDKLVGMLATAEAMGGDMDDAPLLHRLSIELTTIAATAPSHGFDSVAMQALEASRILVADRDPDAAGVRERIRGLMLEVDKACEA